jgi:hypothetical protein
MTNSEPLKVGPNVLCEVIGGLHGEDSPNLGVVVLVTRYIGYREKTSQRDPHFGRVWEAEAEYTEAPPSQKITRRIDPGKRDFLEHWLKPLPREKQPPEAKTVSANDEASV